MNDKSRRKALAALAIALPATWIKPVVKTVVTPAHAITSYTISCVGTPPSGTTVPVNLEVNVVVTVSPNPGAGQIIGVEGLCNGSSSFTDTQTLDANGQFFGGGSLGFCNIGDVGCVRYSFESASDECCWTASPPI